MQGISNETTSSLSPRRRNTEYAWDPPHWVKMGMIVLSLFLLALVVLESFQK